MKNLGFDSEKYLSIQTEKIQERINKFGGKLYLEFGGKLFDDFHASRVLPGFLPDNKIKMLSKLKDKAEVVICINSEDIAKNKVRADLGITYDVDVLRLIDIFRSYGLFIGSIVLAKYDDNNEPAKAFVAESEDLKILDTAYAEEQYAIAVSKENTELLENINKALQELTADGTLQKIVDKYIKAE